MNRTLTLIVSLSLAGAACTHGASGARGSSAQTQTQAQATGSGAAAMAEACLASVPGTQVSAADTATGETITFTTTSADQVTALREKVRAMAEMHDHHHGTADGSATASTSDAGQAGPASAEDAPSGAASDGSGGTTGGGVDGDHPSSDGMASGHMAGMHGESRGMPMPPPSRATVEDVPNGAQITVTPTNPADLARLQSTVRMHAQHMQEHGCGMMGTSAER